MRPSHPKISKLIQKGSQTMRAAVVSQACDGTVEIVERETPKVGPGEALVDV